MSATDTVSRKTTAGVILGTIGVVYGDIGTSPLYAIKECFAGVHPVPIDRLHILGMLSLIFWSLMIVVSTKYTIFMMRADNRGEGGSLALLAKKTQHTQNTKNTTHNTQHNNNTTSLFYGDSMITPAISVL